MDCPPRGCFSILKSSFNMKAGVCKMKQMTSCPSFLLLFAFMSSLTQGLTLLAKSHLTRPSIFISFSQKGDPFTLMIGYHVLPIESFDGFSCLWERKQHQWRLNWRTVQSERGESCEQRLQEDCTLSIFLRLSIRSCKAIMCSFLHPQTSSILVFLWLLIISKAFLAHTLSCVCLLLLIIKRCSPRKKRKAWSWCQQKERMAVAKESWKTFPTELFAGLWVVHTHLHFEVNRRELLRKQWFSK